MTDKDWGKIAHLFDTKRKRKHDVRDIVEAILYAWDNDLNWRSLPGRFPAWQTVYYYFNKWCKDGTWQEVSRLLGLAEESELDYLRRAGYSLVDELMDKILKGHAISEEFEGRLMYEILQRTYPHKNEEVPA